MEEIYKFPRNKVINIKSKFLEIQKELSTENFPKNDDDIRSLLSCNKEQFNDIIKSVSLDETDYLVLKFDPKNEAKCKKSTLEQTSQGSLKLHTLKRSIQLKNLQNGRKHKFHNLFGKSALNYKFNEREVKRINNNGETIVPGQDVLISVRFYRPFRYQQGTHNYGPNFSEEFIVLGSQCLTELRDKIDCICNDFRFFDISADPNKLQPKNNLNPGFFFITDTFYNDTRIPSNPDYSEVIMKWAKEKNNIKELHAVPMEHHKFFDLNISLGYPQLYKHHGNCEHLFTFSSVQLITSKDSLHRTDYPLLKSIALKNIIMCNMCGTREYSFIVTESKRQMHDPCHLCRLCFENYHYVDGKKVGEFSAFHINPEKKLFDNNDNIWEEENSSESF